MKNNEDASEPSEEPFSEPSEDLEEPSSEPSEKPSESSEDPKDIARAMLMAGIPDKEVAEETGLPIRSVYGIKGGLVKAGQIPTSSELREKARKKPGPAEQAFREEGEGVPFRRSRPSYVLIESILNQFGVKERARDLIVSRARRAGEMHPSELERSLMDLDTGLRKREVSYITEEYYLAIQQEEDASRDLESRSYPMRRGEPRRGTGYPTRYGDRDYSLTDRDRDYGGRPWDRSRGGYGGEEPLTMRGLMDILSRRERDLEDRMRRSTLEDKMGSIGEDITVLATELRNLKENPPGQTAPTGPSEYEKALEHTIERQDRRQDELMSLIKEERSEAKADMKELRETYGGRVDKLQDDLKAAERRADSRRSTEGYKADEMRLVADVGNSLVDAVRERGSPVRIFFENLPALFGELGAPPQRERGRPASVADLVGPEYVER